MYNEFRRPLILGLLLVSNLLQAGELSVVVGKEGNLIEQKLQAENLNSSAPLPGEWQDSGTIASSWTAPPPASFSPTSVNPTITEQIDALGDPGTPVSAAVNASLFSNLGSSIATKEPYGIYRQWIYRYRYRCVRTFTTISVCLSNKI